MTAAGESNASPFASLARDLRETDLGFATLLGPLVLDIFLTSFLTTTYLGKRQPVVHLQDISSALNNIGLKANRTSTWQGIGHQ